MKKSKHAESILMAFFGKLAFSILIVSLGTGIFRNSAYSSQLPVGTPSATPAHIPTKEEEITAQTRAVLFPAIQAALEKHCGEDCPSFKIETVFKKSALLDMIEDFGFDHVIETPVTTPTLQSIFVSVLVHSSVSETSREALKNILSHVVSNHIHVPFQVQVNILKGVAPSIEKKNIPSEKTPEDHKYEIFHALVWPVSAVIIMALGIVAIIITLVLNSRSKLKLLQEKLKAEKEEIAKPHEEIEAPDFTQELNEILVSRKEDLEYLIEDSAIRRKADLLKILMTSFSAKKVSSMLNLSNSTLRVLTEINSSFKPSEKKIVSSEDLIQIRNLLDQAHWKRIEEEKFPLAKLNRLSDQQKVAVFRSLESQLERAACLLAIPEEQWPLVICEISADERVSLGLAIIEFQTMGMQERGPVEARIATQVKIYLEQSAFQTDVGSESYSLYLEEAETLALNQQIEKLEGPQKANLLPVISLESQVSEMPPVALRELFSTLEIGTLNAILLQLSEDSRAKVLSNLSESLRERLSSIKQAPSGVELTQARAKLNRTFRMASLKAALKT